jgi:hypothetical protein
MLHDMSLNMLIISEQNRSNSQTHKLIKKKVDFSKKSSRKNMR